MCGGGAEDEECMSLCVYVFERVYVRCVRFGIGRLACVSRF